MTSRILRALAAPFLLCIASLGHAASGAQPITPLLQSVAGGESQSFSVRFTNAAGGPAAGESVSFANDACGTYANGLFNITVAADANGVASATFTARPQGIVCHMVVAAGASVTYTILTYLPANLYLDAATSPGEIKPGQSFSLNVSPKVGAYPIYNAEVSARIVSGTGSAALTPERANTGQQGSVAFAVTPAAQPGDYDIELQFRNRVARFPVKLSATPWQDMWWSGPEENGWGLSIVQHRDMLFSVIYAYDAAGKPVWYVMPGGRWNDAKTVFSGPLYKPRGTPYSAYDASKLEVGESVGGASIAFGDPSRVFLDYSIEGASGRKALSRQPFGPPDAAGGLTVGDMWWGGPQQNGWGIAVLQQYRTLFSVWFTYDATGAPTWLVMPAGYWSDASTYEGRIYRTSGSTWLGRAYDPAAFRLADVGTFRMRFAGDNVTFDYVIEGRSGTMPLVRQPF
jgi:hypothetical protein